MISVPPTSSSTVANQGRVNISGAPLNGRSGLAGKPKARTVECSNSTSAEITRRARRVRPGSLARQLVVASVEVRSVAGIANRRESGSGICHRRALRVRARRSTSRGHEPSHGRRRASQRRAWSWTIVLFASTLTLGARRVRIRRETPPFPAESAMPTSAIIRTLGLLALTSVPIARAVAQAESVAADRDAFVAWATRAAQPLAPLDGPDAAGGVPALSSLSTFNRGTRVIALGESVHDAHEFIVLRTRLTEQLIRRGRVAAVVMETGLAEARAIDAWISHET